MPKIKIGLEVHAELDTNTKLFCGCPRKGSEEPNTRVCPTCLGHPGSKPVLNEKALKGALKAGLALKGDIDDEIIFSRKSYFYPDMSKNFQITQFERPFCRDASLALSSGKRIQIRRIHMEEDPASLTYEGKMSESDFSLIDYNRAGNPLLEIVTEPELNTPAEARDFLSKLVSVLKYLKIFDVETCVLKTDANISIEETGFSRVELKNISGIKEIETALTHEVERQRTAVDEGERVGGDTRGWDEYLEVSTPLREKETEEEYGYIVEPDLCTIDVAEEMISRLSEEIPELADAKADKYIEMGVDEVNAQVIASDRSVAEMFEEVAEKVDPVLVAKWFRRELLRVLNYNDIRIEEVGFGSEEMIELLEMLERNKISENTAQNIMEKLVEEKFSPRKYVEEEGLSLLSGEEELREVCVEALEENPEAEKDYLNGEEKALNFLVGKVMQKTKGKAEPELTNKILTDLIG